MNNADKYVKVVEWSEEDGCFIGSCPELFYGGCHGSDARAVFDELCHMVEEAAELYRAEQRPFPRPLVGKEFVNAMQRIA
jgi:predicted RNase H-like HicB family nuclease